MQFLRGRLSPSVFYHVENLLLWPFAVPEPALDLSPAQAADVVARLQCEVDLLRRLAALELSSLDVTMAQATSGSHAPDDPRRGLRSHPGLEA